MSASLSTVASAPEYWAPDQDEIAMENGHGPAWRAMLAAMTEGDLTGRSLLDFGCNRGGFLRLLYANRPFAYGLGVDIAAESLELARRRSQHLPLQFDFSHKLGEYAGRFDLAFSHEVVYLLPDLAAHAAEIDSVLKPGGVYYLAIGEYSENPVWERWLPIVAGFSPVPPQRHSLNDIAGAFLARDFKIAVQNLNSREFIPWDGSSQWFAHPGEVVDFVTRQMLLFRLQKPL